jgi:nucleotide-binding universal stress UspA family protein
VPEEESVTTVLAALDSNASGRPVLRTAIALADLYDSTVTCLHVREEASSAAAELARAAGVELREVSGSPVEEIANAAQDPDISALVLGARGVHGGPQPAGHTALEVITRIPKPVAVVPPRAQPPERIHRILVPLEGTSESSQALDETIRLAHRRGLEVLVLHVHSPATAPAFSNHDPHATVAWEREFLSRYVSTPHDRVTLVRRLGVPADDIVAVAHETGPDLIVLAWNQDLAPGRARVVSETLAHTDIPVLLLPVLVRSPSGNDGAWQRHESAH